MIRVFTFLFSLIMTVSTAFGLESLDSVLSTRGYVDVAGISPDIIVRLMYARDDNFTGHVLYKPEVLSRAWLHPDAALALGKAQRILSREAPGTRLLVKDAARPMSVQRSMFNSVKGTPRPAMWPIRPRVGGCITSGLPST